MGELHFSCPIQRSSVLIAASNQAPSALYGALVIFDGHKQLSSRWVLGNGQFVEGSAHGRISGDQEDHETIQHASVEQTDIP
jgi:hypothetical protein